MGINAEAPALAEGYCSLVQGYTGSLQSGRKIICNPLIFCLEE
jgi:hypothetical protein